MVCRPIKTLICWLLMTSPSLQNEVTRRSINFTNTDFITERSTSSHSHSSADSLSTAEPLPQKSSTSCVNTQYSSFTCQNEGDNINDNNNSTSSPTTKSAPSLPVHLRGDVLVTSEEYESITYVINVVIIPLMLVGIFTNILTVVVYLRMPRSVTVTFFCLVTVLDVMFLLSGLPSTVAYLMLGEGEAMRSSFYLNYGIHVSNYVTNTLRKVLVCVTMMLSLDRCLLVSFPFRMKTYGHLRRPKFYTLMISVLVFLLDINVLFRYKVMESASSNNGTDTHHVLLTTDLYDSHKQMFFDISLASNFLYKYIPLTVLVVSNILLVAALARHSRQMKKWLDKGTYRIEGFGNEQRKYISENETGQTEVHTYDEQQPPSGLFNISDNRSYTTTVTADSMKNQKRVSRTQMRQDGSYNGQDRWQPESLKENKSSTYVTRLATFKRRKLLSQKSDRQRSMTVLIYFFVFTLLALPSTIFPLLRKVIPGFFSFGRHHFLLLALNNVYFLLDAVSSAVNFGVYFLTSSAFRAAVFALFANLRRFGRMR